MLKNYKPINYRIELFSVVILFVQLGFVINSTKEQLVNTLPAFLVMLFLYFITTTVFIIGYSSKHILKKTDLTSLFGKKTELEESQVLLFIKRAVNIIGIGKAIIIFIPMLLFIINHLYFLPFVLFRPLIILPLLLVFFTLLFYSIKNIIKANGYLTVTNKQTILNGIFYYNPNDKRAVVEKQFGVGTTINFATKQGKIILIVILSIPVTVLGLIFIILLLSGKF